MTTSELLQQIAELKAANQALVDAKAPKVNVMIQVSPKTKEKLDAVVAQRKLINPEYTSRDASVAGLIREAIEKCYGPF